MSHFNPAEVKNKSDERDLHALNYPVDNFSYK